MQQVTSEKALTIEYIAHRKFVVSEKVGGESEEYIVAVSMPYPMPELNTKEGCGCKVFFGPSKAPIDVEVIGGDGIEALENGLWYVSLFISSLEEENRLTALDGRLLSDALPSSTTKQYRAAVSKGFQT